MACQVISLSTYDSRLVMSQMPAQDAAIVPQPVQWCSRMNTTPVWQFEKQSTHRFRNRLLGLTWLILRAA